MSCNDMRDKFEKAISVLLANKRVDNKALLSQSEYESRIRDLKQAKITLGTKGSRKTMKDYRLVKKYSLVTLKGKEKLIKNGNSDDKQYFVTNEELFDILHTTHLSIGHGGRNKMILALKKKYCNVTKESVMIYLGLCTKCQKKLGTKEKESTPKPLLRLVLNSKGILDFIDIKSKGFGEYCFIMIYQDNLTKFTILKPLKSVNPKEVAVELLDIYTSFGAPSILESSYCRSYVSLILDELHSMWKGLKIVIGKSTFKSGDLLRREIEEHLTNWMEENKCDDWRRGLRFVQFKKNSVFNSGISMTPYEAMFGRPARFGIASIGVPDADLSCTNTEEDLEAMITTANAGGKEHHSDDDKAAELYEQGSTTISTISLKEEPEDTLYNESPLSCANSGEGDINTNIKVEAMEDV